MTKIKVYNSEVKELLKAKKVEFPKYTTQIINLANQNSKGTAPKVVGQMSDLIQEFPGKTVKEWKAWYTKKNPGAIEVATLKVIKMLINLKEAVNKIDDTLVRDWVEDLVVYKTFAGLKFQGAILKKVAEIKKCKFTLSSPSQEAKGIDGLIGSRKVSIKPISYKYKKSLREKIDCDFIFYEKKKDSIDISFDF